MLEELKQIVLRVAPETNLNQVRPETRLLEDLGLSSLSLILMAVEIEDHFHVTLPEETDFETVEDVCRYLQERIGVDI